MKDSNILEVIGSLIYHGRHFSPKRDEVVIRKSLDRINEIFKDQIEKAWMYEELCK